ncbi:MAG: NAD+ synthase [Planctomycetes bacterium]|nr:NAD+ synthase [Planctomycetota bacterium]
MSELDIQPQLVSELLVGFLREEVGSAGLERTVVGLSGGVDSAVVVALCARAFGPQNVLSVLLPYRLSNPRSARDAELVARHLGLATKCVDISPLADGYLEPAGIQDPRRRGNVLARCRMTVLYDLSVEWRGLVIGTSNKSEILLGYSTQWGDGAHALNPLGDLYKHQVYQLARFLDLPREVIEKSPSADLFEGQTDEAELGFTYAEADRVLYRLVDRRYSEDELVAEGFERGFVGQLTARVVASQFKRLPPVIAKVSRRSIGHDFRYLRDWKR